MRDRCLRPPGACCPPAALRLIPARAGCPASGLPLRPPGQHTAEAADVLKEGQKPACTPSGVLWTWHQAPATSLHVNRSEHWGVL
ncbi:Hypothetical predicted protein [Marmota monax]|uniref:Uncharacterized protein n=1 Tax=Marmota monax TaxID=9995 RepID=A0A5E4BH96_MARMO|nr:hypothetical protein GHT09_015521 [Marmota monax]VTJ69074.1 Hypothetical predicted protein [Marmota monax]